jgi:hypothetical protein
LKYFQWILHTLTKIEKLIHFEKMKKNRFYYQLFDIKIDNSLRYSMNLDLIELLIVNNNNSQSMISQWYENDWVIIITKMILIIAWNDDRFYEFDVLPKEEKTSKSYISSRTFSS